MDSSKYLPEMAVCFPRTDKACAGSLVVGVTLSNKSMVEKAMAWGPPEIDSLVGSSCDELSPGYCPHTVTVYIRDPIKGYNHIIIIIQPEFCHIPTSKLLCKDGCAVRTARLGVREAAGTDANLLAQPHLILV